MQELYYFLNHSIIKASEANISVRDISILRGFGIFDFLRTQNGRPFLIDDYLDRFTNSAKLIGLSLHFSKSEIKSIVSDLLEKNQIEEAGIRLILTGGESSNAFLPTTPNFAILIEKLHWSSNEWFEKGIKLITYNYQREFSQIKTTNYLTAILLQDRIKSESAMDVLYCHNDEIREVTRSNFFLIKNGTIITPNDHILFGITRKKVIEIAKLYYPLEERAIRKEEIEQADECFMTGTTKKITPVVNIDGTIIGNGQPGKITRHLMEMFEKFESGN